MGRQKATPLPAQAEDLRRRIQTWRETRRSGSAMPEELWATAVSLAQEHGIYALARGLPVDYGSLKKRVLGATEGGSNGRAGSCSFVELDVTQVLGTPEPAGMVVELWGADGARMRLRLPGREAFEVVALANAFWRRGA